MIVTSTLHLTPLENGIMEFRARPEMTREFSVDDIKEMEIELAKTERSHPLFLIFIMNGKYSMEARKYLANNSEKYADKIAMVAVKPMQKLVANFFLGFYKPNVPIKLFTSEDKAREWLLHK